MKNSFFEDRSHLEDIYITRDIANLFYSDSDSNIKGAFLLGNDGDSLHRRAKEVEAEEKLAKNKPKTGNFSKKQPTQSENPEENSENSEEDSDSENSDEEMSAEEEAQDILDIDASETGEEEPQNNVSDKNESEESEDEDEDKAVAKGGFDDLWKDKE